MNNWTIDLHDLDLVTTYNLLNTDVLTIATRVATSTPWLVCVGAATTTFTATSEQEAALANTTGFLSPSPGNRLFSKLNPIALLIHFTFTDVNVVCEDEGAEMADDGLQARINRVAAIVVRDSDSTSEEQKILYGNDGKRVVVGGFFQHFLGWIFVVNNFEKSKSEEYTGKFWCMMNVLFVIWYACGSGSV